jgi:hypothetical protein
MKTSYNLQPPLANTNPRGRAQIQSSKTSALLLRMHALNVLGFQPFITDDHIEQNLVSLVQCFESRTDNGRMMHKDVLPGTLGDEPKPFFIIEPLDFATGHNSPDLTSEA